MNIIVSRFITKSIRRGKRYLTDETYPKFKSIKPIYPPPGDDL